MSRPAPGKAAGLQLRLLGAFKLTANDAAVTLSRNSQRLIVFLALKRDGARRIQVAGTLFPRASDVNALASLRSELWRLRSTLPGLVESDKFELRLTKNVNVDLHIAEEHALELIDGPGAKECDGVLASSIPQLSCDLLPDWYEDWVLLEAEQWRQLRMHALESLCVSLLEHKRYSQALTAALRAVNAEPLRESAYVHLISVHLAEGNQSEAFKAFENYRRLLFDELGLEPTERLRSLLPEARHSATG